jgi:hypothetical protein
MDPNPGCMEFYRTPTWNWLIYPMCAWFLLGGLASTVYRHWSSAVLHLLVAAIVALGSRWTRRTPFIQLTSDELILRGAWLWRQNRIPVRSIAGIDDSRPGRLSLVLQGGERCRVPLGPLEWNDRWKFLAALKSAVSGT